MIAEIVEEYLTRFPDDRQRLTLLLEQAAKAEALNDRKNFIGHVTGAAIVLSPDHTRVLLIHHVILDMWMQPGGHWDPGESDPLTAARREAEEETGVRIARYLPLYVDLPLVPLQIDSHFIPANDKKGEPEHYHHDFRYVFEAADEDLQRQELEVHDAGWYDFGALEAAGLSIVLDRVNQLIFKQYDLKRL